MADISGIQMAAHKRALVSGRLMKRLRILQLDSFSDYVALLKNPQQQEERRIAVDLLTTNETFFFREKPHFDLLLKLLKQHRHLLFNLNFSPLQYHQILLQIVLIFLFLSLKNDVVISGAA